MPNSKLKTLVIASNNAHKVDELKALLSNHYQVVSMGEMGIYDDVPETANSFAGNALLKARTIAEKYKIDCLADDSGLEVDALNGAPGIYSARYAGEEKNDLANLNKILHELAGTENRAAQFVTHLALVRNGLDYLFDGVIRGQICYKPIGDNGFGYDPVFIPEGFTQTFAQLSAVEKNALSHRSRAVAKLLVFLNAN